MVDGKLYFTAVGANEVDGIVAREVYVYDPATGETTLVADISTRTLGSDPAEFTPAGGGMTLNGNVLSNDTDVDHGDMLIVVGVQAGNSGDPVSGNLDQTIAGLYGTLVLHADGSWTYDQDLGAPQASDPQLDVFTYTIADEAGATSTTTLSITAQPSHNANEAPTVSLVSALASLPEDTDTSAASVKVADIVIMDDGVGDNELTLTGADASLFEIVQTGSGPELHLREGVVLSVQDNPSLDVTVVVDDPALGTGPEDSVPLNIKVLPATNLAPFADR